MSFALGSGESKQDWLQYLITIIAVCVAFFIGLIFAVLIRSNVGDHHDTWWWGYFAIQFVPFVTGLLALLGCVHYLHKVPVLSVITTRNTFDLKRFFFAAGLWLLISSVFLFTAKASGAPIVFHWNPSEQIPLLIVCLLLLPLQTAFEDILFRGYLFQGLAWSIGKAWLALVVVSLLFGWIHSGNPEVERLGYIVLPYYILSGLFMGLLTHLDDGLELGMGFHFANNFFGAMILTNTWQVFRTDALLHDYAQPQFGWQDYIPFLTVYPMLIFVFYKIYRWKNPVAKLTE